MSRSALLLLVLCCAGLLAADDADAQPIDVLLLSVDFAQFNDDVQAKLAAFPDAFSSIDRFDWGSATPTLEQLAPYDAVLVWRNTVPNDPDALGDVLADYVDQGGGVATAVFSFRQPQGGIGGRFASGGYYCITPSSNNFTPGSLGTFDSASPLLTDVEAFTTSEFRSPRGGAIEPGATTVAAYTDGLPLITECAAGMAEARRVDLGFFPPSGDVSSLSSWDPTTDGAEIMRNALYYVAGAQLSPPVPATVTGTLATGTCPETLPGGRFTCRVQTSGTNLLGSAQRYTVFLRITNEAGYSRVAKRGEVKLGPGASGSQSIQFRTLAQDPDGEITLEFLAEEGSVAAPSEDAVLLSTLDFFKQLSGEEGLRASEALTVFPNPAAGAATLRFAVAEQAEATLVVYDALGREVARPVDGVAGGLMEVQLDASTLPTGLYVARLTVAGRAETVRLSVVR